MHIRTRDTKRWTVQRRTAFTLRIVGRDDAYRYAETDKMYTWCLAFDRERRNVREKESREHVHRRLIRRNFTFLFDCSLSSIIYVRRTCSELRSTFSVSRSLKAAT